MGVPTVKPFASTLIAAMETAVDASFADEPALEFPGASLQPDRANRAAMVTDEMILNFMMGSE